MSKVNKQTRKSRFNSVPFVLDCIVIVKVTIEHILKAKARDFIRRI